MHIPALSLAVLLSTMQTTAEDRLHSCGAALQRAVGASVSIEQIDAIVAESIDQSYDFMSRTLALIAVESAFNENALSSAKAYGLMQIIPLTQRGLEARYGQLSNVALGTRLLRELVVTSNGNWTRAFAGYNGGPSAMLKLDRGQRLHPETTSYIPRIWYLWEAHCK